MIFLNLNENLRFVKEIYFYIGEFLQPLLIIPIISTRTPKKHLNHQQHQEQVHMSVDQPDRFRQQRGFLQQDDQNLEKNLIMIMLITIILLH